MSSFFIQHKTELFSQPFAGIVEETIGPNGAGRVKFDATYWPAKLYQATPETLLLPEQAVMVVGIQGITLLVRPPEVATHNA